MPPIATNNCFQITIAMLCVISVYGGRADAIDFGGPLKWYDDVVCNDLGCDDSGCDEMSSQGRNRPPHGRGTVGSLFRWRSDPGTGALPQPDEPLVTDRPDFSDASSVVGLGVLQIESGYTYTFNNDDGERQITQAYPETLFRYGILANWLEFRFATEHQDQVVDNDRYRSSNNLYLGLRFGLTPQSDWLPQLAITPQLRVPTNGSVSNDQSLASLSLSYQWKINDTFSLAGTSFLSQQIDQGSGDDYDEFAQAVSLSFALADQLSGYSEYYVLIPNAADTETTEHYGNTGLLYQVTGDIQFDVRAGMGFNDAADDYFVGSGLAIRFGPNGG